jgi:hypothetical protein
MSRCQVPGVRLEVIGNRLQGTGHLFPCSQFFVDLTSQCPVGTMHEERT